jgi:predicted O-methyltransferase YrrM
MHRPRRWLRRVAVVVLRGFSRFTAPVMGLVARHGIGTEYHLRHGFLPVPVHYYQPIFDSQTVLDPVWSRRHDLPGIEFNTQAQLRFVDELGRYGTECRWPEWATDGYCAQNASFGYSSGALLHAMIRHLAPRRVIEIGAGSSTLLIKAALACNGEGLLTTIDPNPREHVSDLPERCEVVVERVECTPLSRFKELDRNDLLFIDSSHVVKTGADVNFVYLDVLPRLRPGVVVHIHDIYLPYEYPKTYSARKAGQRMFWTEQYLLQAFLTHNGSCEVLLAGYWLQRERPEVFGAAFPSWNPEAHRLTSSFYIRVASDQPGR